jgi:hypothetical protein
MYREPELSKLYFDFLQHKSAEVQRRPWDCIMTYSTQVLGAVQRPPVQLDRRQKLPDEMATFRIGRERAEL